MFDRARRLVAAWLCLVLAPVLATAQPFLNTPYDPNIPTLNATIGHASGEAITTTEEMLSYLDALEAAAPDRMDIVQYGESWQGRPLVYVILSAPENMARLDEIKANLARLASGEDISSGELEALAAQAPAVSWLSYGVHGDEISPGDSALALAHHLLAAQDNELVNRIMANTITIIDPNQNPDGRERFVHSFESALGLEPLADRYTAEHDQPWPRGRFNHYLFDLNRDWFALTQPETRSKVAAFLEWHPVVFVDSHEMGGDSTYYFPPAADPYNPNLTDAQRDKQRRFGVNHAAWFDRMGIPYFTREIFDNFYPGYGDMWPQLNGTVAKTFEQASARGLKFTRRDGSELTFREGVRNNFIASLSTAQVVAENKDAFLLDYATYRRDAVEEGLNSRRRYFLIDLSVRRWQAEALGRRLEAQGIDVARLPGRRTLCGETYPDGVLVIDRAQPNGKLITTLMSENTPLPEDFMAEQEARRAAGLDHELYDVTAWSLPLMDGLSSTTCRRVGLTRAERLSADEPIAPVINEGASDFGYAVPWSDIGQAQLVIAALREGLSGRTTDDGFLQNGRTFGAGTVVFPATGNPETLGATLTRLAHDIGAEIVPMETSWVDAGPNFGSGAFAELTAPRVALAWGSGTRATSAGAVRFVIERDLGLPVSPIRLGTLGFADLSQYDVLILPDDGSGFTSALGSRGTDALTKFVSDGGILVAMGGSVDGLTGDAGLLSTTAEDAFHDGDTSADDAEDSGSAPGTRLTDADAYQAMIADPEAAPDTVPGALVRVEADPNHWLASGYDETVALVAGTSIYRPLNAADGTNVFRFAGPEEMVASGYLWEENRLQLAYKPFVMAEPHGDGLVIGFTQSPTTRGYLNGLTLLMANAVVLGPARIR